MIVKIHYNNISTPLAKLNISIIKQKLSFMKTRILLIVSFLLIRFVATTAAPSPNDSYKWLYAKAFNGMNSTAMVVDKDNNTYFSGFSYSDVKYDNHITSIDYATERSSVIVTKLNGADEYVWTKKINLLLADESSSVSVRSMDVDDDGNMYFGGDFRGSITVNSTVYNVGTSYGYFIFKTNSDGVIQWFRAGNKLRGSVNKIKYSIGRIAFSVGTQITGDSPDLFGEDILEKFESLSHFTSCDLVVGTLSVTDGHLISAQGVRTGHSYLTQLSYQSIIVQRNTLDADSQGNIYVTGGFDGNELLAGGAAYSLPLNTEAAASQFLLKIDVFGGVSWVKIFTNSTGTYPTLAINANTRIAVLINGGAAPLYVADQQLVVNGDISQYNHIALFNSSGELLNKITVNSSTSQIAPAQNGSFCVAGNLKQSGQSFGMDWLDNGTSTQDNLFVGFYDSNLNSIAGQSVLSAGRYLPTALKTGTDGKVRLLGIVSNDSESGTPIYPFGAYECAYPGGNNPLIYAVLSPKQMVKAQIFSHGIDCGRFALNVNPNIKSKVEWYVNGVLKGTDFSLMGEDQMGGYRFLRGVNYVSAVITDSTDATNTYIAKDTIIVYNPVVNINTQINPQTGVVNYHVAISNFATEYTVNIDRGNYDYAQALTGSYTYAPGEHTITVILNEPSNHNCFFRFEKTFVVPSPETTQECNRAVIKGRVESSIASFMAGEVRVDLFGVINNQHIYLKSDTIDANGEFNIGGLAEGQYILRANIIDPTKYPELIVTYFNDIMNQVVYWQEATPITLSCNLWADINLTFAALNQAMNGNGSISGVISYTNGPSGMSGSKASVKASAQIGTELMSNVPVILRVKSNHEIVARTVTDENGVYTFENLAENEYEILVEIPGAEMLTTYDVTIDQVAESVENRNFVVTNAGISTTPQLAIVASSTEHGSISNKGTTMLNSGESKSYTIVADNGYKIEDVLVNGTSVGAVSSYNFNNVISNQTIHVIFNSITGLTPADVKQQVYPTVFDNEVLISEANAITQVKIINQLGIISKNIIVQKSNLIRVDTQDLCSGVYIVELYNGTDKTSIIKVLKK